MRRGTAASLLLLLAACVGPGQRSEERASAAGAPPLPPSAIPPATAPVEGGFALRGTVSQGGMVIGIAPSGASAVTLDGADVPLAPDHRFLIAFGRDHGPAATLAATGPDGARWLQPLAVATRAWRIEALPIPRGTSPSPEFLARRKAETDRIKDARVRATTVASDGWEQPFAWPVTGRISGLFGAQRVYQGEKGAYHSGLDVAVPTGTPVRAPADGVVLLAARDELFSLEGHLLMIGHGMGLDSAFLHLSEIDVVPGQRVRRGDMIGRVGMTGRATGPHLHWALTWRGERIDPLLVAPSMPGG
ncbi:M23 family metallopeptidase [Sphingomonas sp.]|uniref:M23 family metallopeptidase n=1 Tax=Sphingomonas sp. TaxID=28214 RepID=UPI003B00BADB